MLYFGIVFILHKKIFVLRIYTLKYLEVSRHEVHNLLLNYSENIKRFCLCVVVLGREKIVVKQK